MLSDEGGIFELMAGRSSASGTPNLDVFLKGHAGTQIRVDRVGRAHEFIEAPTLTIGVAVQPGIISRPADKSRTASS